MPIHPKRPPLGSSLCYEDPMAAIAFLETAFGFERSMIITTPDGQLAHSELSFGDGYIMVGRSWADNVAAPSMVGGVNTQQLHVMLDQDIDAHCEHARAAGAVILAEPDDQFYGDRTYRARDPGGHIWTFAQTVREVEPAMWDKEMGLTTKVYP
jgi:uncharacterized glyoxalase superfamily protein PhnB